MLRWAVEFSIHCLSSKKFLYPVIEDIQPDTGKNRQEDFQCAGNNKIAKDQKAERCRDREYDHGSGKAEKFRSDIV